MEIIGGLMIASLFVGMFVIMAIKESVKEAVIIFGITAALITWVTVAASFLSV